MTPFLNYVKSTLKAFNAWRDSNALSLFQSGDTPFIVALKEGFGQIACILADNTSDIKYAYEQVSVICVRALDLYFMSYALVIPLTDICPMRVVQEMCDDVGCQWFGGIKKLKHIIRTINCIIIQWHRGVFEKYVGKFKRKRIKYTRQKKFCVNGYLLNIKYD